jgi:hypothetical protein
MQQSAGRAGGVATLRCWRRAIPAGLAAVVLTAQAAPAQQIEQGVAIVAEKFASRVDGFSFRPNSSSDLDVRGTTIAPRLSGTVRVRTASGRTEISARIEHAPDPASLGPFTVYVLWAITPEGRATNVGAFEPDGERGRIETTSPLSSFALVVTAEPHFAVSVPCEYVVAQTVGTSVKGTPLEITSLAARARYEGLKRAGRDPKHPVPLELEMARYALAIAESSAAADLAPAAFERARAALATAEAAQSAKRVDRAAVAEPSREAIQAAEDARAASALRRGNADLAALRSTLASRDAALQEALAARDSARVDAAAALERVRAAESRLPTATSRLQLAAELLARWLPTERAEAALVAHVASSDFISGRADVDAPMMERLAIGAGMLLGIGGFSVTVSPSLQLSEDIKRLTLAQQRARGVMDWLASVGIKAVVGPPPASSSAADAALSTGPGVDLTITPTDSGVQEPASSPPRRAVAPGPSPAPAGTGG